MRLWPASIRVLRELVAVCPLLCVNPARPVGWLVATDSSSYGGGAVFCSQYGIDGLRDFAPFCYYKGRGDLSEPQYREGVGQVIGRYTFETGFGWRWKSFEEHITLKEGRALWVGIQRVVLHSRSPLGARHTYLQDNMGVIGAFQKGRSRHPVLNGLIKRTCALQLVTGDTMDLIWCPTLYQPADGPSRGVKHRPD
mgnify:FL=1